MSGPFTISSTLPHVLELDMRILSHFMVPSSIFFISFGLGAVYHKTEAHIVMKGTSRVSATSFYSNLNLHTHLKGVEILRRWSANDSCPAHVYVRMISNK